ncbi:hypothetical protein ACF08N_37665 [Streptomyces sp. NPDC015127]|uniref:hypothetical protein n=1 Tax=Streptomyces sp. NPDC015127 TaxID=3364939 RepID=UPI0036FDD6E5
MGEVDWTISVSTLRTVRAHQQVAGAKGVLCLSVENEAAEELVEQVPQGCGVPFVADPEVVVLARRL